MNIKNLPVSWYVDKIQNGEPFSLGHYGDGEWQCIFNQHRQRFTANCEGTQYTPELSKALDESLKFKSENFYFATPAMLAKYPYQEYAKLIDQITDIEFVEKNVWNDAMCNGELGSLIRAFREKNVCIISNRMLRGLTFLNYDKYIEIGYPDCFDSLERVTKEILDYGKEGIYLFACGIPASLFVQAVHGKIPNSWFLDLGSIWDGFVGIGGQRATRREFYLHPETWHEWVNKNLGDIEWPRRMPRVNWYGMGSLDINPKI